MSDDVGGLRTPALLVDLPALDRNLATMASRWPGERLRPHVKAHKSTALARRQAAAGHRGFTCATVREVVSLARAGLGEDLLLANEVVDVSALAEAVGTGARVTVAVDSDATVAAARAAGVREVLIDVNVGLPRCGCVPGDAPRLADAARAAGIAVRGVMGYEGHLVGLVDVGKRVELGRESAAALRLAADAVGGDVVSGGGTGTWATNTVVTELQAGSYVLMDSAYTALPDVPFEQSLTVLATVVSVSPDGFAVADAGLKTFGMDHGNPSVDGMDVLYCSDEHVVFRPQDGHKLPRVGDRIRLVPAHVDPTCSQHERFVIVDGGEVVDLWPIDMRNW